MLEILKSKIDVVLKEYKSLKHNILRKLNKKENFYKTKEDFIKSYSSEGKGISLATGPIKSLLTLNIKNVVTGLGGASNQDTKPKPTHTQLKKSVLKSPPHEIKNSPIINENISSNLSKLHKSENTMIPISSTDEVNIYSDSQFAMSIFKATESKDLEKTKQILFELSDLVNTFSHKVVEQQQITENSKHKNKLKQFIIVIKNSQTSLENIKDANKELVISQEYQKGRGITIGLIFIVLGLFLIYYDYTL